MLSVIALGGNALHRDGASGGVAGLSQVADLVASMEPARKIVLTHGNGPQIGLLALQADNSPAGMPEPLDVLGAETEGQIGYLIDRELSTKTDRPVATILTQTLVDPADPGFAHPTKPIGPFYSEGDAQKLAIERGWEMVETGRGFRRVVASPAPLGIVELEAIRLLAESGAIVVCCGGGGVPVAHRPNDGLMGVEAVVDKDLASALLAIELGADELVLLTDVDGVRRRWGSEDSELIETATPAELRALDLAAGSMAPKAEACAWFVERTEGRAAIGALEDAEAVIAGDSGTQVGPAPRR